MIRKLRLKFIAVTMALLTVMMCVILGLIIHFTARNLEAESFQTLRAAATDPGRPGRPGERPAFNGFIVRTTPLGTMVENSGGYDLSDEALLKELIDAASAAGPELGELPEYGLRYCRQSGIGGMTIVFGDISAEKAALRSLTITSIAIGLAALLALWGVSILLARWMIRPVEAAWQEQRQFVADASHELKTPLTVILTNAELLVSEEDPAQQQKFTASILSMSHQMRSLVESLLELARVDNGAVQTAFAPLNLSELTEEALLPFEPVYFERGLLLHSEIQPGITVSGSADHLRRAMGVLLDNAMKYTPSSGTIWVRLIRQGSQAILSVANPGEPLTKEECRSIFRRFYRADKVRNSGGYGLGLPIALGIAQDHGGKLWAESKNGFNIFTLQLPCGQ